MIKNETTFFAFNWLFFYYNEVKYNSKCHLYTLELELETLHLEIIELKGWWIKVRWPYPPSHVTFWPPGYVAKKKRYIWTSILSMVLKRENWKTYLDFHITYSPNTWQGSDSIRWTPSIKSCDHVVPWKTLYPHFQKTYGKQTCRPRLQLY